MKRLSSRSHLLRRCLQLIPPVMLGVPSLAVLGQEDIVVDDDRFLKAVDPGTGNVVLRMTAYFTAGGSIPKDLQVPPIVDGVTPFPGPNGTYKAELITIQHTYAANFDIDLAPKTSFANPRFEDDGFDNNFLSARAALRAAANGQNSVNGFRVEDYNYELPEGTWPLAKPFGFDIPDQYYDGPTGSPCLDQFDLLANKLCDVANRPAPTQDQVNAFNAMERVVMTCNLGPQYLTDALPDPNNVAAVGESFSGPYVPSRPIASNGSGIQLISGPLAAYWAPPVVTFEAWWAANQLPGNPDPAGDLDSDGYSNYQEFLAGTNPRDPGSRLHLTLLGLGASPGQQDSVRFVCSGGAGHTYFLEQSVEVSGPWQRVGDPVILDSLGSQLVALPQAESRLRSFYRLVTE